MNKWTSVKSGKPGGGDWVIVALDDGDVWLGFHNVDDGWMDPAGLPFDALVTHWQHLPEPPQ